MTAHDDLLAEADTLASSTLSITFTGPSSVEARDYVIALEEVRDRLTAALRSEITLADQLAADLDYELRRAGRESMVDYLTAYRAARKEGT